MKRSNRLVIEIKRPTSDVFSFVLDPNNTPRWLESVVHEEVNEWPVRVGTIYRNQNRAGVWATYKLTEYVPNERFVLHRSDNAYAVQYVVRPLGENLTELEYVEWLDQGAIEAPFTANVLQKLKIVLEAKES